uniref:2TM domain-containing protein n=1 Tax=uncultured organism TaxID=155900 RepID=D8VMQ4_9ZZZZ|nr:conserved hypothetical protein [uncultured organism]
MHPTLNPEEVELLARKRATIKLSWYIHATVYLAVNLLLALIAALNGHNWAVLPALGWGLGLAIHGAVVFLAMPGSGLHERLLRQERARLQPQRDPW